MAVTKVRQKVKILKVKLWSDGNIYVSFVVTLAVRAHE